MLRTRSPRKEKISNCYLHSNSLSNKMDNSLLAVRDINNKYTVVAKEKKFMKKRLVDFLDSYDLLDNDSAADIDNYLLVSE